jgi:hypothetical protein
MNKNITALAATPVFLLVESAAMFTEQYPLPDSKTASPIGRFIDQEAAYMFRNTGLQCYRELKTDEIETSGRAKFLMNKNITALAATPVFLLVESAAMF